MRLKELSSLRFMCIIIDNGVSKMIITYDKEADAISIIFNEDASVTTEHITDDINFDYDAKGQLAGIEILDVKKSLGKKGIPDKVKFLVSEVVKSNPWQEAI